MPTILAERGRLIEGPNGPRVVLFNGSRQEIDRQNGRLNMLTFGQNALDLTDTNRSERRSLRDMTRSLAWATCSNPHPENRAGHPEMDRRGP